MSTKASKPKYVTLSDVRVAYRPKDDTIHLTSTDKDLVGEPFRLTLKPGTESDLILRQLLIEKGVILTDNSTYGQIPEFSTISLDASTPAHLIPLGEDMEGVVHWDTHSIGSAFVVGGTGTGKSTLVRNIIHHCLSHNDEWIVYGIDPENVSLSQYLKYANTVREVATTGKQALQILNEVVTEIHRRYAFMEANDLTSLRHTMVKTGYTTNIMVVMDGISTLYGRDGGLSIDGFEDFTAQEIVEMRLLLGTIFRLGRAAKVHTVFTTQQIEESFFIEKMLDESGLKIACGRISDEKSQYFLQNDSAARVPSIRGRAVIQRWNETRAFQIGYSSDSSGEQWVLDNCKTDLRFSDATLRKMSENCKNR